MPFIRGAQNLIAYCCTHTHSLPFSVCSTAQRWLALRLAHWAAGAVAVPACMMQQQQQRSSNSHLTGRCRPALWWSAGCVCAFVSNKRPCLRDRASVRAAPEPDGQPCLSPRLCLRATPAAAATVAVVALPLYASSCEWPSASRPLAPEGQLRPAASCSCACQFWFMGPASKVHAAPARPVRPRTSLTQTRLVSAYGCGRRNNWRHKGQLSASLALVWSGVAARCAPVLPPTRAHWRRPAGVREIPVPRATAASWGDAFKLSSLRLEPPDGR